MLIRSRASGSIGRLAALALAAALALGLAGCQKLFTTSLAEGLARDGVSLPSELSVDQAADLVEEARASGDAELAGEIVSTLVDQVSGMKDSKEKQELQAAAAAAAVVACDVTDDLASLLDSYSDGSTPGADELMKLAGAIKDKASGDILAACGYLDPTTGVSDPSKVDVELSATDYAVAAVILMASVLPDGEDPSAFDYDSLSGEEAARVDSAANIIKEAVALVDPDSESYDLLQSISEKFKLM
jgi:hypothetical protein